jgi:hypothetical protein
MIKSFFTALVLLTLLTGCSLETKAQTQSVIAYWNSGSPSFAVSTTTLMSAFEDEYGDTTDITSVTILVEDQLMYVVAQGTKNGEGRLMAFELVRGTGGDANNMYVRASSGGVWHTCKGVCCSWCELNVVKQGAQSQIQGCRCNTVPEACTSGYCEHSTGVGTTGYIGSWY